MNKDIRQDYLHFAASKQELTGVWGDDLFNVEIEPEIVSSQDVLSAIQKYQSKEIDTLALVEWVNTIWFTDLYEYNENESDCIASVMTVLETLDEDDVFFTEEDYEKMLMCLSQNKEYEK